MGHPDEGGFLDDAGMEPGQRRVEERTHDLKRANEDLERFAYAASHDLQEPVRTVANFAELLQQRHAGKLDADGREFLGYILNSALNMRRLIEDLLDWLEARDLLAAGRLVMPLGPTGIGVVAHRLIYRRAERANPEVQAFVEWLMREIVEKPVPPTET